MQSAQACATWFCDAFDADYLALYAHRDRHEAQTGARLLASYWPAERTNGPVLDLCCGTARHAIAMAQLGYRVVGLDLSSDLLDYAASHECEVDVSLVRGDMRELPFARASLAGAVNWFTSFGYFLEEADNVRVARELSRVIAPGGFLLWDHINPPYLRATFSMVDQRRLEDGSLVRATRHLTSDGKRVEKRVHLHRPDGSERIFQESVRLYESADATEMWRDAGFETMQQLGDYRANAPLNENSPRQILLLRRSLDRKL